MGEILFLFSGKGEGSQTHHGTWEAEPLFKALLFPGIHPAKWNVGKSGSSSAPEYHDECQIGDFVFFTLSRKTKIWKMSFECCLEHAENLEQCAVPCSSQNSLYALGLHWYQSLKGRLKGCPTPPEWEGQRKGKRDPLETSSKDNPRPEEPVLTLGPTLLAVTLIDTAKPLCTSCSPFTVGRGSLPSSLQSTGATVGPQWVSQCPRLPSPDHRSNQLWWRNEETRIPFFLQV